MNGQNAELERILAESRAFFAAVERRISAHVREGMRRPAALELAIDEELAVVLGADFAFA